MPKLNLDKDAITVTSYRARNEENQKQILSKEETLNELRIKLTDLDQKQEEKISPLTESIHEKEILLQKAKDEKERLEHAIVLLKKTEQYLFKLHEDHYSAESELKKTAIKLFGVIKNQLADRPEVARLTKSQVQISLQRQVKNIEENIDASTTQERLKRTSFELSQ